MNQNIRENRKRKKLNILDVMVAGRRRHRWRATSDHHLFAWASRSFFFHDNGRSKIGMARPLWQWWCGHCFIYPGGGPGGGATSGGSSGGPACRVVRFWNPYALDDYEMLRLRVSVVRDCLAWSSCMQSIFLLYPKKLINISFFCRIDFIRA